MKRFTRTASKLFFLTALATMTTAAFAQSYDLSWSSIDGGGGTSTGGAFSLTGTIGQPDAQAPPVMTSGTLELTGGYWPAAATICTLPGDMNQDGRVNGADIQLFINCLIAGTGSCGCADLDGGGVGINDVAAMVTKLLGT
ncbi:MAG TPA: hypothetical protein VMV81_03170 [Phycisphaerae bacterium]|nr:hypothetical protein [Phycisphaerae bacterium]